MKQYEKIKAFLNEAFSQRLEDTIKPLDLVYTPDSSIGNIDHFIREKGLSIPSVLILFLALAPNIHPCLLKDLLQTFVNQSGGAPQIGGVKGKNHRGVLPTGEMVLFLLAGDDLENRMHYHSVINSNHPLFKDEILELNTVDPSEPLLSPAITVNQQWFSTVALQQKIMPRFTKDFPAQLLETELNWEDLILASKTEIALEEIINWLDHNDDLINRYHMNRFLKPGFRALFFGPPGVGKTLAVSLLGKHINRPVFRVDLSMVVSKFIGETEKNLASLFKKAENKDWILFFDEADSIFGKRTNVRDAHDRYANQEVSYLLQRIESFNGLVILATNFKSNLDAAFARRFQAFVEFEMPNAQQRYLLWQNMLPPGITLEKYCNLIDIAEKYSISGANILNVVQYAAIIALKKNRSNPQIFEEDILVGIKKELKKEGRV